jgi:hypothetical protein
MYDPFDELVEELEFQRMMSESYENLEPGLTRALEVIEQLRNQEDD